MNPICKICGKPLSDPISVELGIGPVCRVKQKIADAMSRQENLFASRAKFEYGMEDGILYIFDRGGMKSVTNDMENVLGDIARDIGSGIMDYLIMYQDSMGIWDGVEITRFRTGGRVGFRFFSLNEREFHKAKKKLESKTISI